jgi:hypothetical protein
MPSTIYHILRLRLFPKGPLRMEFPNHLDRLIFKVFDVPVVAREPTGESNIFSHYQQLRIELEKRGITWPFGNADDETKFILFRALMIKRDMKLDIPE